VKNVAEEAENIVLETKNAVEQTEIVGSEAKHVVEEAVMGGFWFHSAVFNDSTLVFQNRAVSISRVQKDMKCF
jgi:hypothetical protein